MTKDTLPKRHQQAALTVPVTPKLDLCADLARCLEVLAGCELQHGFHGAAERLAWLAAALREAGR